jgi:hypothetical protein
MAGENSALHGSYVSTTQNFDVQEIYATSVTSPAFKELLVRLYQNLNKMAINLNLKDTGYYDTSEFINGQSFFPAPNVDSSTSSRLAYRQVFRKVLNFFPPPIPPALPGHLPNAPGTVDIAHNITINNGYSFTRIYGAVSDPVGLNFLPLPYASPTLADNIELRVDGTKVYITVGKDRKEFTVCYVILEYINK